MQDSSSRYPILFGVVCLMVFSQLGGVILCYKETVVPFAAFVVKSLQLQQSPPDRISGKSTWSSSKKNLRAKEKTTTTVVPKHSSSNAKAESSGRARQYQSSQSPKLEEDISSAKADGKVASSPATSNETITPTTIESNIKTNSKDKLFSSTSKPEKKISTSNAAPNNAAALRPNSVQKSSKYSSPKPSKRKSRLKPQQILDQYIEWHGQASLERQSEGREFVVGYYSCPSLAGNRMHDFFNTMVAAIATNKTLLYKFWDHETCEKVLINPDIQPIFCDEALSNTIEMCDALVERASWLPSYDEWAPKLNLSPLLERGIDKDGVLVNGTLTQMPAIVEISSVENLDDLDMFSSTLVTKKAAISTAKELYSEGVLFASGMLFQEIFPLKEDKANAKILQDKPEDNTISIALHSRHWTEKMDGTEVSLETNCLKKVMDAAKIRPGGACNVYIMSDRDATLTGVSDFVKAHNCTPVIASHEKGEGIFTENGPFAKGGFFQDLKVAQQARHGFVGNCGRSSSQLLRELIEYNRFVENLDDENYRRMDIPTCCLPDWDWVKPNETKSSVAAYAT